MGSCHLCERLSSITKGAKCAAHETSTSPIVDRRRRDFGPPGPIGEVPFVLAGGAWCGADRPTRLRYEALLVAEVRRA